MRLSVGLYERVLSVKVSVSAPGGREPGLIRGITGGDTTTAIRAITWGRREESEEADDRAASRRDATPAGVASLQRG